MAISERAQRLWDEVKANSARKEACPRHHFTYETVKLARNLGAARGVLTVLHRERDVGECAHRIATSQAPRTSRPRVKLRYCAHLKKWRHGRHDGAPASSAAGSGCRHRRVRLP
jgi:hypothetical protein